MTHVQTSNLKSLKKLNFSLEKICYQLSPNELTIAAINQKQGVVNNTEALVINTGQFTGRSPKDKYIVYGGAEKDRIDWSEFNNPLDPVYFEAILDEATRYLNARNALYVRDAYACADPKYQIPFRIVNELPAMNLFAYNMLIRPEEINKSVVTPDWHIISAPGLKLNPTKCGTRQGNAIIINFEKKIILIVGSGYTGEIKKAVFTVLNYLLPQQDVLPMHCAANMSSDGSTALFFGLSGTGKTTLSTDPYRRLIGDDEHGWSETGIFNFEGGCYAKCIHLTEEKEPDIYNAIKKGALVENTRFFENSNIINFNDSSITENTRVSYPLSHISNRVTNAMAGNPKHIIFLTCDAFGVLPPVSKLFLQQANFYFLNGYTAKVAGTENGIKEPKPTFSACFGAPFMPLHPRVYANMLEKQIVKNEVTVWMVNTGWIAGAYGEGYRIPLDISRKIIAAILSGKLGDVLFKPDPTFGLNIPLSCPDVPTGILCPRNNWKDGKAYDRQAQQLKNYFIDNYAKFATDNMNISEVFEN
ncbi:phosphoenolpyruvate carboxykinase (ATP) [Niabella insulamsoli]|uniref:phosphoenolpyruvate carboxykinase (ATP) n=1 Tax=Niabella insulamsoli TaxID=3144874 RepID=UPI0031FCA50D